MPREVPKPDFMEQADWDNLMAARDPAIIRMAARAHVQAYLDAKGEGQVYLTQGAPTCLVGTTGRRSGKEQIAPANFFQDGDDLYIVGSIAGNDQHPAWALNLDSQADGWVQVKGRRWQTRAHKLAGSEREAMWPRLTEFFPLWGHFQKYCDREFMVFRLSPQEG